MSGDTWVALDGTDPDVFTTSSCWVSDVGLYIGPIPVPELPDTTFVPDDASSVIYLIAPPNPDADDSHVLATGAYAYSTTNTLEQDYDPPSTIKQFGDPSLLDSGSHLFVLWFPLHDVAGPSDLPTLTVTPLDLAPIGWVSGARLDTSAPPTDTPETGTSGGAPVDLDPATFTLHDTDGTLIGTLADVKGGSWQHELSAPGSLSCMVAEDDALFSELTPKRIIKAWWRGGVRMAARIDASSMDVAVDGRRWRQFSQLPGALAMLADGIVYPEYGKDRSSSGQRWFGYMSSALPLDTGNFSNAEGYSYNSDTTNKKGKPDGLSFPNPYWIAKNGPTYIEAGGQVQVFRKRFTTSSTITYQILATADDFLTLWLDGEKLFESDQQTAKEWMFLQQITGTMPAGSHLIAAKVVNARGYVNNPMALIFTLQRLQGNGDVVDETPLVNSSTSWRVADNGPGFRRGDVLATVFDEARARGVYAFSSLLSRGYTHTTDSNGDDWTDDPGEYALDVSSTVLDAVQVLTETAIDTDMDFDTLTHQVFNRKGTDLSGSVTLAAGVSVKVNTVDRVEAKFNTALVQKADGSYTEVADSASVSAFGRIETGLTIGSTATTSTAQGVATAAFVESAHTAYTFTVAVSTLTGPQPYDAFEVGDSITLVDDEGTDRKVRVMAITVDVSNDRPEATVEVAVDRS